MSEDTQFRDLPQSKYRLLSSSEDVDELEWSKSRGRPRRKGHIIVTVLLVCSVVLNIVQIALHHTKDCSGAIDRLRSLDNTPLFASPVRKEINMQTHTETFNGSFFKRTVYRGEPSEDVDKAWEALLMENPWFTIPLEDGAAYGLRKNYHVQMAPEYGESFAAAIEGVHHLHCVNMLRQVTFFNFEYYRERKLGPFGNSDEIVKTHTTHCIDTLRQIIMCQPDLGLLGQVWVDLKDNETKPFAFGDFNTRHKCYDWNAVIAWGSKKALPAGAYVQRREDDFTFNEIP